ncbi:AbrB family transcriptional regulator [Paracoccus sp. TK19116]|uniref:AbrB family transcriptional regulator n=1 Tax=Paracoccus albicereus TaxID=2922394 RepID=A0ABT1MQR1_9RHOB|nr:AbrB family transcriptional regulator [Paracoccus albicereus]MCQ0969861.1 AbrB family transcriptional regulator [Paracoccus albicereus]
MLFPRIRLPQGFHNPTIALTLTLAGLGGAVAHRLNLPLGWLMGSLLTVAALALSGWRPMGHPVQVWPMLRTFFVPVIGVAIGANFTPAILREIPEWWTSLLALVLFVPAVHFLCFRLTEKVGSLDRVTAFFGTLPGGLIEAVEMGAERGADIRILTVLQFLRLILVIVFVPLGFTLLTGHAVGSAGGAVMGGGGAHGPGQLLILLLAGLVGTLAALRLSFPAPWITGPILLSGALHLTGVVEGAPPSWLIAATQVVIGTALGVRFAGMSRQDLWAGFRLSVMNTGLVLVLAAAVAAALSATVELPPQAVFLAFAPGGLAEMSLIALSLNMGVVYVSAHHVVRILLSVMMARFMARRLLPRD